MYLCACPVLLRALSTKWKNQAAIFFSSRGLYFDMANLFKAEILVRQHLSSSTALRNSIFVTGENVNDESFLRPCVVYSLYPNYDSAI